MEPETFDTPQQVAEEPPPAIPGPPVATTAEPQHGSFQPLSVADGAGTPLVVASVVVYAFMELVGKPIILSVAASRGKDEEERKRLVLVAVVIPGCLVALAIDPTPLLAFLHVTVPWWATVPIGGLIYGGGGVITHRVMKVIRPVQVLKQTVYKRLGVDEAAIEAKHKKATKELSLSQSQMLDMAKARKERDARKDTDD